MVVRERGANRNIDFYCIGGLIDSNKAALQIYKILPFHFISFFQIGFVYCF